RDGPACWRQVLRHLQLHQGQPGGLVSARWPSLQNPPVAEGDPYASCPLQGGRGRQDVPAIIEKDADGASSLGGGRVLDVEIDHGAKLRLLLVDEPSEFLLPLVNELVLPGLLDDELPEFFPLLVDEPLEVVAIPKHESLGESADYQKHRR